MPLDGITLHFLVRELSEKILGNKIDKIFQPSKNELIFHLRSREGSRRLLVSASPNAPRLCLTSASPENPATPPPLCMLLRKRLVGASITGIRQLGLDRIVFLDLAGTDEIGDRTKFTLCVEIMANRSDAVLVDADGIIIDAVKRIGFTDSSKRRLAPSLKYEPPPSQNKLDITKTEPEVIVGAVLTRRGKRLSQAVLETLEGASPLICREIAYFVSDDDKATEDMDETDASRLAEKLCEIREIVLSGRGVPAALVCDHVRLYDFTFMNIFQYGSAVTLKKYDAFSELLDEFYYEKDRFERTRARAQSLMKTLNNARARAIRKLQIRKAELAAVSDCEASRINGELILANQRGLEKGSFFYDLENFYDGGKTTRIAADPALSPSQNAQKYFKEYRKAKNARRALGELIEQNEREIEYLQSVTDAAERAEGYSEIAEIREELFEQGYLKRAEKGKVKKSKPAPPRKYVSDDGYAILVGRNNLQNDLLSFKIAAKEDVWFHAQKIPGSHVVAIGKGEVPPERTLLQAAAIAAYHSAGRESSRVAVDYTRVRELKKPVGARPGKVVYHAYNTMRVSPDRELCERLSAENRGDGKKHDAVNP